MDVTLYSQLPNHAKFRTADGEPRVYIKTGVWRAHSDGAAYKFNANQMVVPLEAHVWVDFTIKITHYDDANDSSSESLRMRVTEDFETELYRLVRKYSGKAGLVIDARNSETPIVPYHY